MLHHNNNVTRFSLGASFQVVNRLFVLAFNNANNDVNEKKKNS